MSEKILMLVAAFIKENASIWYPYKGFGKSFRKYRGSLAKAIYDLKEHGFLEEIEIEGERHLRLTPKGRIKLIKKKIFREWDGFWRIIAFDIEEKRRKTRDLLRIKLDELGCKPIQKSVWITPYDISFELEELIDILNLENNVDYFLCQAITESKKYKQIFKINTKNK